MLFQSEPEGFSHFHLYVCAAFLIKWRKEILDEEDFQVSRQELSLGCDEHRSGGYPISGLQQVWEKERRKRFQKWLPLPVGRESLGPRALQ